MNKKIPISIITVVKNDEEKIERTIKSIINQKEENDEYIVVDGNSSDNTKKIIDNYRDHINQFISEPDKNLYDAINKGIEKSSGEIIGVCLSGDHFKPKAFETIKKYFFENPKLDFLFGTIIRNYLGAKVLKNGFNRKKILYNFDSQTSISSGFFIRKDAQDKVGKYDINFSLSADYDFFYRLLIKNNLNGSSTTRDEIIGEMSSGGLSSKVSHFNHLIEESKIRIKHKQNIFLIFLIIVNSVLKNLPKIFKDLKK